MTVAELIAELQATPDLSAVVKFAAGATVTGEVGTVTMTGANSSTPPSDGPESSNEDPDPGIVELDD